MNTAAVQLDNRFAAGMPDSPANLVEAGWRILSVAWACEDDGHEISCRACLSLVADLWTEAIEQGLEIDDGGLPGSLIVLADVQRRSGRFDDANATCRRALSGRPAEPYRSMLEFELELITKKDNKPHARSQALG